LWFLEYVRLILVATGGVVSGNYGLEKFSHLEDKIYRTIEQIKRERQLRESLERELTSLRGRVDKESGGKEQLESLEQEVSSLRKQVGKLSGDKERLESQLRRMLGERHKIKHKVEGMLDTITRIDPEAEAAKR
jgi:chromosome segregation ATPase